MPTSRVAGAPLIAGVKFMADSFVVSRAIGQSGPHRIARGSPISQPLGAKSAALQEGKFREEAKTNTYRFDLYRKTISRSLDRAPRSTMQRPA